MSHDVVAHYLDGRLVKGTCLAVDPSRPQCHVQTRGQGTVPVALAELKALFFVKTLDGDSTHQEDNTVHPGDPRRIGVRVVAVNFKDGERLVAFSPHFPPNRDLFFVNPVDSQGNNDRVLVNKAACRSVEAVAEGPGPA